MRSIRELRSRNAYTLFCFSRKTRFIVQRCASQSAAGSSRVFLASLAACSSIDHQLESFTSILFVITFSFVIVFEAFGGESLSDSLAGNRSSELRDAIFFNNSAYRTSKSSLSYFLFRFHCQYLTPVFLKITPELPPYARAEDLLPLDPVSSQFLWSEVLS